MIHNVSGDLLESQAKLICHGVAPGDHFSQGLALGLRERWPSLYKDFRHYCQTHHPKPGGLWMWHGPGINVANLLTQEDSYTPGSKPGVAHLEFVNSALRELRKEIVAEGYESLALPRLATGVGRLDWDEVAPLIAKHLGDLGIPIFVYTTYHKGEKAQELSSPV
jgi:O-acetyl-ADP-ribose deacetylase (regulator of RNase III)